jgi:hypothetical protein
MYERGYGRRMVIAILRASITLSAFRSSRIDQPTMRLVQASMTTAR